MGIPCKTETLDSSVAECGLCIYLSLYFAFLFIDSPNSFQFKLNVILLNMQIECYLKI